MGKHVNLPFFASNKIVNSPFDLIHCDIWNSPLPNVSGLKYYVIFLDHYSHYLWVYPLRRNVTPYQNSFVFAPFIYNKFNHDIHAFQFDHGGEFDNKPFVTSFTTMSFIFVSHV